jgi:anaerobic selenocysteine-containing dehydrogenase
MSTAQRTFTCNLCDAMCGLHLTVDDNRVTGVRGNPKDVLSRGHLCPKAVALGELHADPDRLRTPMRRTASGFEPISWDDALDEAATRLRAIQRAHGRDAVASYIGNPNAHRHHSAFAAALLSVALGSRNRFDANSQDGNPRLFANFQVYGDGLSMTVPDVDRTDWLLLLGANPAVSHGSTMALGDVRNRLRSIRERGGRVVLIDPRRTESAAFCDEHHFIRPGADAALLLAFLHVLFAERLVDERALAHIATGLDEIRQLAARFSPEQVASAVGIDALTITRLAREFASTKRSVIHARLGPSVGEFGPLACWLVEVLHAVAGKLDQEGGAMFPSPAADVGPIARRIVGNGYDRYRSRVRGLPEFLGALPSAVMAEEMETE